MGYCLLALNNIGKPMIAGLQGRISAEYLGLTLLFDLRIATPDTTISFDNVRTGIPSSPSITHLMPGYIGTGRTLALANQGAVITAQEALDLGLISAVIEKSDDLTQACINKLRKLTANHRYIVVFNHRDILPTSTEISTALETYLRIHFESADSTTCREEIINLRVFLMVSSSVADSSTRNA